MLYVKMNMMDQFGEKELMKVTYSTDEFEEEEGLMKVTDKYDVSVCRGRAHESYILYY